MHRTTILLTMAGASQRFADAGYSVPKYMLEAHGHSVFSWAVLSLANFLGDDSQLICICRKNFPAGPFLRKELRRLGVSPKQVDILELDAATDGQATSALRALPAIRRPGDPVMIYNIDTHCDPAVLRPESIRGDGWVPCFPAAGDWWSFARADENDRATEIAEKRRISNHCTLGLYWFRCAQTYSSAYTATYETADGTKAPERYVAPLYNSLIARGMPVYIERIPAAAVSPIGTPAEYDAFLRACAPHQTWPEECRKVRAS